MLLTKQVTISYVLFFLSKFKYFLVSESVVARGGAKIVAGETGDVGLSFFRSASVNDIERHVAFESSSFMVSSDHRLYNTDNGAL